MGGRDSIVMGMVNTLSGKLNLSIPYDQQNNLMSKPGGSFIDLAAFNINRDRDHGIPGFHLYYLDNIK